MPKASQAGGDGKALRETSRWRWGSSEREEPVDDGAALRDEPVAMGKL